MDHVERIKEHVEDRRNDPTTPEEHKIDPARLCRILEFLAEHELFDHPESKFAAQVFEISHLAAWDCIKNHPDWLGRFLILEKEIEMVACSPNDQKIYAEQAKLEAEAKEGTGT